MPLRRATKIEVVHFKEVFDVEHTSPPPPNFSKPGHGLLHAALVY